MYECKPSARVWITSFAITRHTSGLAWRWCYRRSYPSKLALKHITYIASLFDEELGKCVLHYYLWLEPRVRIILVYTSLWVLDIKARCSLYFRHILPVMAEWQSLISPTSPFGQSSLTSVLILGEIFHAWDHTFSNSGFTENWGLWGYSTRNALF